ncbi:response regulator [Phormidium sp. CLA17]|uniref:response regulator n=1 Tax=Leptolyngbya sp. Cla-17 TaxID=2803751 RepID=UPI0014928A8F|nr:response regulator [Leptolyngbya sp. Cla-17]MBM0743990.1 response regulator [Leptolyngbya sp. Cla-17]
MTVKQILVVDDDAAIREVVAACLQYLGHWDVRTAASGKEALRQAKTEKPDAIVLDVMMPEMDGFAVLQDLHSNPTTQPIPVVLLTAHSYLLNTDRLPNLGVVLVIFKPFNAVDLVRQIAQALQ